MSYFYIFFVSYFLIFNKIIICFFLFSLFCVFLFRLSLCYLGTATTRRLSISLLTVETVICRNVNLYYLRYPYFLNLLFFVCLAFDYSLTIFVRIPFLFHGYVKSSSS